MPVVAVQRRAMAQKFPRRLLDDDVRSRGEIMLAAVLERLHGPDELAPDDVTAS